MLLVSSMPSVHLTNMNGDISKFGAVYDDTTIEDLVLVVLV